MASRGVRDQMVLATKYVTAWRGGKDGPNEGENIVNTGGTGAKSLRISLKQSLQNFQTDYIDLLYIHWWDFSSSIEELMHSLNDAVTSGKVLYLGASDTPAWVVAKANQYARDHGLRQFSVYQGRWNASARDFERDIIPMCAAEKMALAPWAPLGGGAFKTEEEYANQTKDDGARGKSPQSESLKKVVRALDSIAKRYDTKLAAVALAYVLHKAPYVFPIVGGRKIHHLKENIEALGLKLKDEDIKEIEEAGDFDLGFPHTMIGRNGYASTLNGIGGAVDWVEEPRPIPAKSLEERVAEYKAAQNPLE
jgi:aryl-alcohol dehydrogenase-like predicted oxidoreductase